MDWNFIAVQELVDPATVSGALVLAVEVIVAALVTSKVLTKILMRPRWVIGSLERKVDKTVIRYTVRIKTLVIFMAAGLIYASLVPGLRGLMGAMMAGAGISALVCGFRS